MFGKFIRYCPNCGVELYDSKLPVTSKSACCSTSCLEDYELKVTRSILGKDTPKEINNGTQD